MRHGEAVDLDVVDADDQRWLTPKGRATVRRVGEEVSERLWSGQGKRIGRVLTSPRVRAVQTAELVAGVAAPDCPVVISSALAYGTTAAALSPLEELAGDDVLLFVGHMPLIASMAGQLAGRSVGGFRTAMVRAFDLGSGPTELAWTLDPYAS